MPECRLCHRLINKQKEVEGVDWFMPSRNYYYHIKCYTDWKANQSAEDAEWKDRIYDFLSRDLKVKYNYQMCEQQRKKYLRENKYTNKGIYFALKYFYEVKKNSWDKGHGGIGIVEYVYNESRDYWIEQEKKQKGFVKAVEQQLKERAEREVVTIKRSQKKKNKAKYDLDEIGGED